MVCLAGSLLTTSFKCHIAQYKKPSQLPHETLFEIVVDRIRGKKTADVQSQEQDSKNKDSFVNVLKNKPSELLERKQQLQKQREEAKAMKKKAEMAKNESRLLKDHAKENEKSLKREKKVQKKMEQKVESSRNKYRKFVEPQHQEAE